MIHELDQKIYTDQPRFDSHVEGVRWTWSCVSMECSRLLRNERRRQRDQRRKVEHNAQGLHTMERVINSSPYAFIYVYVCVCVGYD